MQPMLSKGPHLWLILCTAEYLIWDRATNQTHLQTDQFWVIPYNTSKLNAFHKSILPSFKLVRNRWIKLKKQLKRWEREKCWICFLLPPGADVNLHQMLNFAQHLFSLKAAISVPMSFSRWTFHIWKHRNLQFGHLCGICFLWIAPM